MPRSRASRRWPLPSVRPDLRALIEAAESRGVRHVLDETILTLGAGAGSLSWPLDALPTTADVPWLSLHEIPVAVVTGSNGKTTTVRLIAACARAHGWRDGFSCTDGVFVGHDLVRAGDYSGPAGTRAVLRDPRVEAAVLETARGGILRRGLAIDHAIVAVVTNVSADHFGEYGIHDLEGLADVKLSVAQLVARDGLLVLNADDDLLRAKAAGLGERLGWQPPLGWFALDFDRAELRAHRESLGATCGVRDGRLMLSLGGKSHDLGAIGDLPITVRGHATYNVANLAGAALAAAALGIAPATIASVFGAFGLDPADNSGRLMRFDLQGVQVLLDYAHNPDGLRGVLHVAQATARHRRAHRHVARPRRQSPQRGHRGTRRRCCRVWPGPGRRQGRRRPPARPPAWRGARNTARGTPAARHVRYGRADLPVGSRRSTDGSRVGTARRRRGVADPFVVGTPADADPAAGTTG